MQFYLWNVGFIVTPPEAHTTQTQRTQRQGFELQTKQ